MRSSRKGKTASEQRNIKTERLVSQHQRLYQALNLGTRFFNGKGWEWQSTDIEIQRHAVRSITLFLDCVSRDTLDHPLVKGSVADMVGALLFILKHGSAALLGMAADCVVNLIGSLPNSLLQPYLLDLVDPLLSLLSFGNLDVSISCATALNIILSNLKVKDEKDIWEKLCEREISSQLVYNLCGLSTGELPLEYFKEMAFLLSTILHRWPSFRYAVWSNAKVMEFLGKLCSMPDNFVALPLLKLCSGLALCGKGSEKLLENGEVLLPMMVLYMGESYPPSVWIEGFRLARCLVTNEQGCLTVMRCCCEPFVQAIMSVLGGSFSQLSKVATEEMTLLMEASRLALVLRWEGKHHDYFWKEGIDAVLLDLLLGSSWDEPAQQAGPLKEQISKVNDRLKNNFLLNLRPYIWDVLGWLVTHCGQDLNTRMNYHVDILVICACLSFVDSINRGWEDLSSAFRSEAASRVALLMIHSPCKYIGSRVILALSEILESTGNVYLKRILSRLNVQHSGHGSRISEPLQVGIHLMNLACYSALPQYRSHIVKSEGIKMLLSLMRSCLSNDVRVGRTKFAPDLCNDFCEKPCCLVNENWEGNDILPLYSLMGLSELLPSVSISKFANSVLHESGYDKFQFISTLEEICRGCYSPGLKWYAIRLLSYFGIYGFPSKLGSHIGKVLHLDDYMDVLLVLPGGSSIGAHGVILASRCPPLLPCEASDSVQEHDVHEQYENSRLLIRLSSKVDSEAMTKLLEFLYLGFLHAEEHLVKKLKVLAKHCCLQSLLMVLGKRRPKWGTIWPSYNLVDAVGPAGYHFSDIILEAKPIESTWEGCSFCSIELPHVHAHKVVLSSRSEYMRALLQSGMQESHSPTIKVPTSWEAMSKLVSWFYSDDLPGPSIGCNWHNIVSAERLNILQPYIELCWLAGFWFLDEVKDTCYRVVLSCLDSSAHLPIEVMKTVASFGLWDLAEIAASNLAPSYRQLCQSGVLEGLDQELVETIRVASVRLSQEER